MGGSKTQLALPLSRQQIAEYCRRRQIRSLSLFGSVLRADFSQNSDVDVLVEFEPGHVPGLAFFEIQDDLSVLLGRRVDLNTPNSLSHHFRNTVIREAETVYAAS